MRGSHLEPKLHYMLKAPKQDFKFLLKPFPNSCAPKVSLLLKSFWISMESFQGKAAFFHRTFRELSTKVSLRAFNESDFGEFSKKSQSAFGELSAQVSLLSESFQKSASPRYQVWGEWGSWFWLSVVPIGLPQPPHPIPVTKCVILHAVCNFRHSV